MYVCMCICVCLGGVDGSIDNKIILGENSHLPALQGLGGQPDLTSDSISHLVVLAYAWHSVNVSRMTREVHHIKNM